MTDLLITIIAVLGAALLTLGGYAIKVRADADGWKLSYQQEKVRGDELREAARDDRLATAIATKFMSAFHTVAGKDGGP